MKPSLLKELLLYRYRYVIGYGLFAIMLLALLGTDISRVPYGISQAEMKSVVASNALDVRAIAPADIINLPYHALQKLSVSLLGLTPLGIRLPSLVIGFLAALALAATLNKWFRPGIGLLALLIGATSVPFISMTRTGTSSVLYMLLLLLILLSAAWLTSRGRGTFFYKLVVLVCGLLLCYMPLGVYAILALLLAGMLHPHVRYQIKRTRWWQFLALLLLGGALAVPLILTGMQQPSVIETLLGIDNLADRLTISSLLAAAGSLAKTFFLFHRPYVGEIVTPFVTLPFALFCIFGFVKVLQDRHSARSYLLIIWLSAAVLLLLLHPSQYALLFVPLLILLAIGLDTFLHEWYRLFPHNPYARIIALLPLGLITIGMLATSSSRYFYGYLYTDTTASYHPELTAVTRILQPVAPTRLIVPSDQQAFYDILRQKNPQLTVTGPGGIQPGTTTIVLAGAGTIEGSAPSRIVTSYFKNNSVVLRVYAPQ